jgi:dihydrofolate reductase
MTLSCILAVSEGGVIGIENRLPWRLPRDLKRFRALTMGHTVIMGRRTHESIGSPLSGRRNIVLTGDPRWSEPGVETAATLSEALSRCGEAEEVFVIGGESVFREALPRADRLYVTLVHADVDGDRFFPLEALSGWNLVREERHEADEKNRHPLTFRTYERPQPGPDRAGGVPER